MQVPVLTALQFAVIDVLVKGELAGHEIRDSLQSKGFTHSSPAFYMLMDRMEVAGLIVGRYHQIVVEGVAIRERRYDATSQGVRARTQTRSFYIGRGDAEPAIA